MPARLTKRAHLQRLTAPSWRNRRRRALLIAVLDGELCCVDSDGGSNFYRLMFRREQPYFYAFDVLAMDGHDLTMLPLVERKARLHAIMPHDTSRLLYVDAIPEGIPMSASHSRAIT